MKKTCLFIMTLLSAKLVFAAPDLNCKLMDSQFKQPSQATIFSVDSLALDCSSEEGKKYEIVISGKGIGEFKRTLKNEKNEFIVGCPFVRTKKFTTTYRGIKVSVGYKYGADVAIFMNKRLGVCYVGGWNSDETGIGATLDKMTIKEM